MIRTTPPRDPYNIGGSVPLRIGPTVKIAVWIIYQFHQIPATSCSAERSFSALRRIKMTDIQREKKIQCHVVGHKMPSVTESRGTGRNFLAIYADARTYARSHVCALARMRVRTYARSLAHTLARKHCARTYTHMHLGALACTLARMNARRYAV